MFQQGPYKFKLVLALQDSEGGVEERIILGLDGAIEQVEVAFLPYNCLKYLLYPLDVLSLYCFLQH